MAKQQQKQPVQSRKQDASSFAAGGYLLRNLAVLAGIAIVFFSIDRMNDKEDQKRTRMQELYNEFMQQQKYGGNQQRMMEIRDEAMALEADTSWQFFKKRTVGYHFAVHKIVEGGMNDVETAKKQAGKENPTREEKLAMRIGLWPLIDKINKSTPENAVIYLPYGDESISNNGNWNYIYDPEWMEYFLYPRLCLTIGREKDYPALVGKATHVVIVEGKGYDKLKYDVPVEQRQQVAVLPIDQPAAQTTN